MDCFYGYFSLGDFCYFCINDGILTRKHTFAYDYRITKCLLKWWNKVAMDHKLLVFEVMNEKQHL